MGLTTSFAGSATEYAAGNGDVSEVASGSTYGIFTFKNINDFPIKLHIRESDTTDDLNFDLSPGEYTIPIYITLTSARTIDYYIEGGGSIQCYVVAYGGSAGLTTVLESDVSAWLTMLGYTVSASGNITIAQVQLCLDKVVAEIGLASSMFELKALYAVNTAFKNRITLEGAVAEALYALRNAGASTGLTQDRIIVSTETADRYKGTYDKAIDDMKNGWNLGA